MRGYTLPLSILGLAALAVIVIYSFISGVNPSEWTKS